MRFSHEYFFQSLKKNRTDQNLSQLELAELMNKEGLSLNNKIISNWEKGKGEPSISIFVQLCRVLNICDIYEEFYGTNPNNPISELNNEGKQKVYEYADLLIKSGLYQKPAAKIIPFHRSIRLFDIRVSAGTGNILDGDHYEMIEVGKEVPDHADFGVRITGDSMQPRYVDGQIVFVHRQQTLGNGEIGIFYLEGNAYIKKLQDDKNGLFLISLNPKYEPIPIHANTEFKIFGKVVG